MGNGVMRIIGLKTGPCVLLGGEQGDHGGIAPTVSGYAMVFPIPFISKTLLYHGSRQAAPASARNGTMPLTIRRCVIAANLANVSSRIKDPST